MTNESAFLLACLDEKGKAHIEQHGTLTADEGRALIRAMIDHYFENVSPSEALSTINYQLSTNRHATIEESKQ